MRNLLQIENGKDVKYTGFNKKTKRGFSFGISSS